MSKRQILLEVQYPHAIKTSKGNVGKDFRDASLHKVYSFIALCKTIQHVE